jgi:hypothetical protein
MPYIYAECPGQELADYSGSMVIKVTRLGDYTP